MIYNRLEVIVKKKILVKIIVGILILFSSLLIILYAYSEILYRYSKWNIGGKKEKEEYEKTLERYRNLNPDEFLVFLKDNYQYFLKENTDNNVNYLYELTIENNVPILSWIDFYNGEKIIRDKTIFDDHSDKLYSPYFNRKDLLKFKWAGFLKGYYYIYVYRFYADGYGIITCIKDNGINELARIYLSGELKACESKRIENILFELSQRITETQYQYVGEYEYQNIEIIKEYGNKNRYGLNEIKKPKVITITCTNTGNLHAVFEFDLQDHNYEWDFFIDDNGKNEIGRSVWDDHSGNGSLKYYIENDYIIHHFETNDGYINGGDGYTIEYKIYYKRTNGA
jgi:hypothetical protein